jgi:amidophosphoribosyltransferase
MHTGADDGQLREKCAVFGLFSPDDEAARITFYGLWALQHRGQEGSGIVTSDGTNLYRHAEAGLVANVYHDENIETLRGNIAIGHNRYATSGGAGDFFNQPFLNHDQNFALAHNGNLPDYSDLLSFLKKRGISVGKHNDTRLMEAAIACYMADGDDLQTAIINAYPLFTGVFSAVAMDKDRLVAFRDECGIRPLSIGTLDGGYVVASETCAFDTIGAKYLRDVKPGELVVIDETGITSHQVVKANPKIDVFELVYFARPDSTINGQRVNKVRQKLGHEMAQEFSVDADVIIPVPDSSIPAALGYSQSSGIPFDMGLIKNRYIHRTFIQPTAELRKRHIKMKLNPIIESIVGKRVILVDDSIVRGTTMRQVVQILREAGAKEIHLMISSPPVLYPDFYGINTPDQDDLIAAKMNQSEICEYLGADSLHFLSIKGMVRATGLPQSQLSMSCFDGVYPIPIGDRKDDVVQSVSHKHHGQATNQQPIEALA